MNKIVLLILWLHFTQSYSQCDADKNYNYFHSLIRNEKDNIQSVFDGILDKYGDVDNILNDLLNKLNKTIDRANSGLNQLQEYNDNIKDSNNDSSAKLQSLFQVLKAIKAGLMPIHFNTSWAKEKEDAEKAAKKSSPWPASELDIIEQKDELEKWKKFLEELVGRNFDKDIMNLPHTVTDELNLLEKLIAEEADPKCFDKFHNDLKLLFLELANLFDLNNSLSDLDRIKAKASENKKGADDIHSKTNQFLEKEKLLEDVYHLTNESLALAEEIEKLKESIKRLSGHNSEIINDRLKKLQEDHEAEIQRLNEKYNVKEGQQLLKELKDTKQQIDNIDMASVEKDIENYTRDINYYTCILEKCESGTETISSCTRE